MTLHICIDNLFSSEIFVLSTNIQSRPDKNAWKMEKIKKKKFLFFKTNISVFKKTVDGWMEEHFRVKAKDCLQQSKTIYHKKIHS